MAFIGSEKLKHLFNTEKVIENYKSERIVCGAYELSLGEEVFISDSKDKKKQFLKQQKEQITINPGQFALLLTEETVNMPVNKIAFISIKAGIKLKGLINVSGFHVDPGFKGNLVFSVYNAGSSPISLVKGESCFLIWFADLELTANEITSYEKGSHDHKNQNSIPVKYIDSLIAGELASPSVLSDRINDNHREQSQRISLLEKDQKANNYIIVTIAGLVVALIIKFVFDWAALSKGYEKGLELKDKELCYIAKKAHLDSIINTQLIQKKNLINEIDSLEKKRHDLVTQPKH